MYLALAIAGLAGLAYGLSEDQPVIWIISLGVFFVGLARLAIKGSQRTGGSGGN